MGMTTPAIGIYIPAAGETNYDQSFAQGMYNIDQHDHSGEPNKGLPIATEGLGNGSVTYPKLNVNVADPTTGIGTSSVLQNQLIILDLLKNIFQLPLGTDGFITKDGILAHARTFQNSSSVTWTNADGIAGNPSASVNIAGISPVPVANGGTGLTSLNPYDILLGGTSGTGNVQQVVGEGTAGQYLGSNGINAIPSWQDLPAIPPILLFQSTVTLTASQFKNLSATKIQIVPAFGAGKVAVPVSSIAKLNFTAPAFTSGSSVRFYYGSGSSFETPLRYDSGTFDDAQSGYYQAVNQAVSTTIIPSASIENTPIYIGVNSSNFATGNSTVTFTLFYNVVTI